MKRHLPRHAEAECPDIQQSARAWFEFFDEDGNGTLNKGEVTRALIKTFRLRSGALGVHSAHWLW
jgi:Ca2+-binding EF-hand superfamily protein